MNNNIFVKLKSTLDNQGKSTTSFKQYITIYENYIKYNHNRKFNWLDLDNSQNNLIDTNSIKFVSKVNKLEGNNIDRKIIKKINIVNHLYNYFNYINLFSENDINNFIQNRLNLINISIKNINNAIRDTIQDDILYKYYNIKNTYNLNDIMYVPTTNQVEYYSPLESIQSKLTFITNDYYTINNKNYDIRDIIEYNKSKK